MSSPVVALSEVLEEKERGVFHDELPKLRSGQSECLHIIRPLTLDGLRMAQHIGVRQDFLCRWAAT
jgi:hypothetical protein